MSMVDDIATLACIVAPIASRVDVHHDHFCGLGMHYIQLRRLTHRSRVTISEHETDDAVLRGGTRPLVALVTRKVRSAASNLRARVFRIGRAA